MTYKEMKQKLKQQKQLQKAHDAYNKHEFIPIDNVQICKTCHKTTSYPYNLDKFFEYPDWGYMDVYVFILLEYTHKNYYKMIVNKLEKIKQKYPHYAQDIEKAMQASIKYQKLKKEGVI